MSQLLTRKSAVATEIAQTNIATVVALCGAKRPKLMNRMVSQKTTITRNGGGRALPTFCSTRSHRDCVMSPANASALDLSSRCS